MNDILKICPFCGGLAQVCEYQSLTSENNLFCVMCKDCFASSQGYASELEAKSAWNNRHEN